MGSAVEVKEYRDFALSGCRKSETADGVVCDVGGSIVLDIADDYAFMDAELIDLLQASVAPYLP